MCNLYSVTKGKQAIAKLFEADLPFELPEVKTHIYPKFTGFIVRKQDGARVLDAKTGGIPCRVKGKRPGTFVTNWVTNVRNLSSPFWRSALANPASRCLVPFERFASRSRGRTRKGGRRKREPYRGLELARGVPEIATFPGIHPALE